MAYGTNRNQYGLKEGRIFIGDWDAGSIDPDDPLAAFTNEEDLGDFQQGSLSPEITRAYAEFLVGTPAIMSRKDLIRKQWMISATFAQYNADLMQLVQGLDLDDSGTWDVAYIGSDEVIQPTNGYSIITALVAGQAFVPAMFNGKVTAEAVGPTFPGTTHSTYQFKVEAFPDEDFLANDVRNYGAILIGPIPS